jgi:two-component system, chemotaxis family, protein-glutamate methylesterase/glutaminase
MRPSRIIGIGASAGGVEALFKVLSCLPSEYDHAVIVVLHVPLNGAGLLPQILARHCELPVGPAAHGQMMRAGHVYVAPADHHMLVSGSQVWLSQGPKENGVRPAIDATLRSIALARGPGAVAVILSGALGDGSAGARAVATAGGRVLIQDPAEALVPSMPESAIKAVPSGATILTADRIGARLAVLHTSTGEDRSHSPLEAIGV